MYCEKVFCSVYVKTKDAFIFAHLTIFKGCRMGAGWKKIVEQNSVHEKESIG
jgi:hypothetical protein